MDAHAAECAALPRLAKLMAGGEALLPHLLLAGRALRCSPGATASLPAPCSVHFIPCSLFSGRQRLQAAGSLAPSPAAVARRKRRARVLSGCSGLDEAASVAGLVQPEDTRRAQPELKQAALRLFRADEEETVPRSVAWWCRP